MFDENYNALIITPNNRDESNFNLTQDGKYTKSYSMNLVEQHKKQIEKLCKKHAVQSLYVFGSILHENFSPESDIDLLVEFDWSAERNYWDCYWELKTGLETLLNRKIDLVCDSAIRNPRFRSEVDQNKESVYAA